MESACSRQMTCSPEQIHFKIACTDANWEINDDRSQLWTSLELVRDAVSVVNSQLPDNR
jgi:hypothetical protein